MSVAQYQSSVISGHSAQGANASVIAYPTQDAPRSSQTPRTGIAPSELEHHLLHRGTITHPALERAKHLARDSGEDLLNVLTRLGLLSERALAEAFAEIVDLPLAGASEYPAAVVPAGGLSDKFLRDARVIPLFESAEEVGIAIVNPLDTETLDAVRFATGRSLKTYIAYPADFESAFERLYGARDSEANALSEQRAADESALVSDDVDRLRDLASEAPVIRLVNALITRGVESRASDIHIEPMENELRIRYRVDGVLLPIEPPPQRLAYAIISRLKIMAKLNIAERRLAQDGRIKLAIRGKDVDFRVSTTPTVHGESVVLRVLDKGHLKLDFAALGFEQELASEFRRVLNRPHGILLVTGPTGSGKTTTLYTALLELNTIDRKILTIEDPVEYQLEGINQVQVKPQIGLTFANALRSFLRQDPDIMMVGEIRDLETAQIAVQAALTGHLILSTLHTNDAVSTIARLLDMGVEDYLISSTLNGIAAQRLVRRLCTSCRSPYQAPPEFIRSLGIETGDSPITLYRSIGCDVCGNTGFAGRCAIVEVLPISDSMRQRILQTRDANGFQQITQSIGMRTMQAHGLEKARSGVTTVEEVLRVCRAVGG